jgi:hypothetical protein
MAKHLRALGRNEAKLIYRNDRLLIGWRTTKPLQTEATSEVLQSEAWVGKISREEDADDEKSAHLTTTDLLRVYTTPDGPDQLSHGVMGVDEAHPAVLHPHVTETAYLDMGKTQRLKMIERRLKRLKNGRKVFCEFEGGELKILGRNVNDVDDSEANEDESDDGSEWDGNEGGGIRDDEKEEGEVSENETEEDDVQGQAEKQEKRKRDSGNCNSPSSDTGGGKRHRSEPTIVYRGKGKVDNRDDDDEHEDRIPPKNEKPTSPSSTAKNMLANQRTIGKSSYKAFNASFSGLGINHASVDDEKKADQDKPMSSMQLALQLGADVNQQAYEWALPASMRQIDLNEFTKELSLAMTVVQKIAVCRKIFARMEDYHMKFNKGREVQQFQLDLVVDKRLPDNIIAAHRYLVDEYRRAEIHVRDTVRLLEERADALENMDF